MVSSSDRQSFFNSQVEENQISSSRVITADFKFYVVCESMEVDIETSKSYKENAPEINCF